MKGTGDHGSKVPLNLGQRQPAISEPVVKSDTFADRAARDARAGTPPTRWGMINGVMPTMQPAMPTENPVLVLKAVRDPAMANAGLIDRTPRKRNPDGKFATAQSGGVQSTATDDLANREREAHLAAKRRYLKAVGMEEEIEGAAKKPAGPPAAGDGSSAAAPAAGGAPMPPNNGTPPPAPPPGADAAGPGGAAPPPAGPQLAKPQPPQQPGMMPGAAGAGGPPGAAAVGAGAGGPGGAGGPVPQNPMSQAGVTNAPPGSDPAQGMGQADALGMMGMTPIGQTPEGMPVFDDPYNPAHQSFTPDQHQYAAQLHNQQAEMLTNTGRIPSALDQQMKAQIHMDLANDAQSPMERMVSRQNGNMNNPMDDFLQQMGANTTSTPGSNNAVTGPGPATPDQNKPLMPDGGNGPLPGMTNTHTGTNIGPQTQASDHAGTIEQPQGMPPEPTDGSMPSIQGQGMDESGAAPKSPFQWSPDDFDLDESGSEAGGGLGAIEAPPSHAGAPTQAGPDEGVKPTPDFSESEPPTDNPGPSVDDNNPAAGEFDSNNFSENNGEEPQPTSGDEPVDEEAAEEEEKLAKKSFDNWLFGK